MGLVMADKLQVTDMTKGVYRRVYAGFLHGKRINSVSMCAEAWFWRINAIVDDFGNWRYTPKNLCVEASPEREVTVEQVVEWMRELAAANLIRFYTVDGKEFFHVVGFVDYQPSGKNGKRVRRVPEWEGSEYLGESERDRVNPGESKTIQTNPDISSASHNQDQDQNQDHHQHHHQPGGAGGVGGVTLTRDGEAAAKKLAERPPWLAEGLGWITVEKARELVLLGLPPPTYLAAMRSVKEGRKTSTNPAGLFITKLQEAAKDTRVPRLHLNGRVAG